MRLSDELIGAVLSFAFATDSESLLELPVIDFEANSFVKLVIPRSPRTRPLSWPPFFNSLRTVLNFFYKVF